MALDRCVRLQRALNIERNHNTVVFALVSKGLNLVKPYLLEQLYQIQDELSGEAKLWMQEIVWDRLQVEPVQGLVTTSM